MTVYKKVIHHELSELDIVGATLLSAKEVEKLPLRLREYKNWWWLRSRGCSYYSVAYVYFGGSVNDTGDDINFDGDVRPALLIKKNKTSNLKIGDVFIFGGKDFEIISNTLAFCKSDIGNHRFDTKHNDYKKSEIKKYVDEWFEKNKE